MSTPAETTRQALVERIRRERAAQAFRQAAEWAAWDREQWAAAVNDGTFNGPYWQWQAEN